MTGAASEVTTLQRGRNVHITITIIITIIIIIIIMKLLYFLWFLAAVITELSQSPAMQCVSLP